MSYRVRTMRVKTFAPRKTLAALAVATLLGSAACAGGSSDDGSADGSAEQASADETTGAAQETDEDDVLILRPGAPGEEPETGPTELPEAGHNDADVEYLTMMIPHHRQALVISDLAKTRAGDPTVRRIASRIRDSQAPEISYMSDWLTENGYDAPAPEDDRVDMADHMGDMGMLTADELAALVDAEGEEFDRLYLDSMIGHHRGAIGMSDDVAVDGEDIRINELAADISVGQKAEINRMKDILEVL
jgi:uncharacterized protein (DUF305 family)